MQAAYASTVIGFIQKATRDNRLSTSDMSVYMALIACWQDQGCPDYFVITRREVMLLAKIAAISTYHRCIRQLMSFGYIIYQPTYDSYTGTKVSLKEG